MVENAQENFIIQLIQAIKNHDLKEAEVIKDIQDKNYEKPEGSFLHISVLHCNLPALIFLLQQGLDFNLRNKDSSATPLFLAITLGYLPLAAVLLQAGANPNIPNKENKSPMSIAILRGDPRAVQLLADFDADCNFTCSTDLVRTLTKKPESYENESLLSVASTLGHATIVRILIDHDVQISKIGTHPVIGAFYSGNPDILNLLLHREPKLFQTEINGKSVFRLAIESKTMLVKMVSILTPKDFADKEKSHFSSSQKKRYETSQKKDYPIPSLQESLKRTKPPKQIWAKISK